MRKGVSARTILPQQQLLQQVLAKLLIMMWWFGCGVV
jgi:hypothetical protein